MKIEHVAVGSNSEQDADKFFMSLLGLEKTRSFTVSSDLMEQFFGVKKEQQIIRYEDDNVSFEVFITKDDQKTHDIFTHSCLLLEDRDSFVENALSLGFSVTKVPRKESEGYYLFVKDSFNNLYEIKKN